MAAPTGFEPAIPCVTGRCDKPLHHGAIFLEHRVRVELTIRVLQTLALPLGYRCIWYLT